ncbi:hypothetical protein ALP90_200218 [Pseudomonas amygdali pv. ulmi]|uniref:Uncharacterized protein n=1 Tax=Pseudomonas amygdali pv. ulmi TaxID=251720 RepID=A0A3M4SPI5_PSEA0|nr:hypothetical protein [Pseudomonas amygdali]RMR16852.1 hypothetical protein ALP90_200218 [Pseudomonas amygdali pv. ulmi]
MAILNAELRDQVKALGWTVPKGVEMRLHVVPVGQLPGQRASITVITEKGSAPDLSFLQEPGFSIMANDAAVAAIQFALVNDEGLQFLRHWNQCDFDVIRREWPEAPEEVFIGADSLHKPSK